MSAYDLVASTFVTLQSFLVDKETSRRLYAVGNTTTCNFLGWGFQFSCGTFLYFGAVSTYYLMVVRFGIKDAYFGRRIEPFMHASILLFSIITSLVSLGKGLYGEQEIGAGCYLSPNDDSCDAACVANLALLFTGIPYVVTLLLVLANNLTIYCHVRRTVQQYIQKSRDRAEKNLSSVGSLDLSSSIMTEKGPDVSVRVVQKRISEVDNQQKRVQLVRTQSLLYCVAFVLSYMWTLILRAAISYTEGEPGPDMEDGLFLYMVLRAIFAPAIGFWTFLIYARPRYLQLRERKVEESRLQTLIRVIQDDDVRGIRTGSAREKGTSYQSATNGDSRHSETL